MNGSSGRIICCHTASFPVVKPNYDVYHEQDVLMSGKRLFFLWERVISRNTSFGSHRSEWPLEGRACNQLLCTAVCIIPRNKKLHALCTRSTNNPKYFVVTQ